MTRTPGTAIEVKLNVTETADAFAALDDALWQERRLLERLAYRLAAQHAVIGLGETRWLAVSDSEVKVAVRDVRDQEVVRAAETERVLRRLRRPADTSLAQLATMSPAPWPVILDDHRVAMRELETTILTHAGQTVALLESLTAGGEQ
jgi:hypothetical protein